MIIIYHNHNKVVKVSTLTDEILPFNKKGTISSVLIDFAIKYPESGIVWCNENFEAFLNLDSLNDIFYHEKMMLSYNPNTFGFLGKEIGYIDASPFIKINKEVTFPTWEMSSLVGVVHSKVLLEICSVIKPHSNFDYYLNSIAKVCMPLGLLCYSEPRLLKRKDFIHSSKSSRFTLFRFTKQHYKLRWTFILFLNFVIYEFKFPLLSLIYSVFFRNINKQTINIDKIEVDCSSKNETNFEALDVIIPTIGRKENLYDFLQDLSSQTYLPKNVIIVEQNPLSGSVSELDYLTSEDWPFEIKHTFTNQAGACNARNIALDQVESEWIFFADDDIRIDHLFIESAFKDISKYKCKAVSFSCLQKDEKKSNTKVFQWNAFGSGCSFVKSEAAKMTRFDLRYEFGFGEDGDFGMQLRNMGCDVLYFPNPAILHLKAPIGGFRTKPDLAWNNDSIKPKPSPTVSLYKILHETKEQHKGYKVILFFKYYRKQSIKNPLKYFTQFQKEWAKSLYWANKLFDKV